MLWQSSAAATWFTFVPLMPAWNYQHLWRTFAEIYFSRSTLRQQELKQFQEFVDTQPHKMLSYGQTRWLSMESCVNRMLEQWPALQLYFIDFVANGKDPSHTTESILKGLCNKFVKAQLEFMSTQLHHLNCFKTMFQTTEPMLHHLRTEVLKLLKTFLADFVKLDIVRTCDPLTLDSEDGKIHVPTENVYLGISATLNWWNATTEMQL